MRIKRYKRVEFVFLILMVLFFIWSIGIEPSLLYVKNYDLSLPEWPSQLNGLKIAIITDLHVGSLHIDRKKVVKVVEETNKTNPDLILLLGDYVASNKLRRISSLDDLSELSKLKAKHGVYAILGNHDWWHDGVAVRRVIESSNLPVLENSHAKVEVNGKTLWLVGLADLWTRTPDIDEAMKGVAPDDPRIIMTHSPDLFPSVGRRATLTLAGHTHGGQVCVPPIGPIIVPSRYGTDYARGHIEENGHHLFVSSGIGTSILPIRFCCAPEISVLVLHPTQPGHSVSHEGKSDIEATAESAHMKQETAR